MKEDLVVDEIGTQRWYKYGKIHREDGPAAIYLNGTQTWFKNGKIHREDGPAIVYSNGTQRWYKYGKIHREDGPAVVYSNGTYRWYLNNKSVHKEDILDTPEKRRNWEIEETIRKL